MLKSPRFTFVRTISIGGGGGNELLALARKRHRAKFRHVWSNGRTHSAGIWEHAVRNSWIWNWRNNRWLQKVTYWIAQFNFFSKYRYGFWNSITGKLYVTYLKSKIYSNKNLEGNRQEEIEDNIKDGHRNITRVCVICVQVTQNDADNSIYLKSQEFL